MMSKKNRAPGIPGKSKASVSDVRSEPEAHWAVLREDELQWPGATLLALLLEKAHSSGLSYKELAEERLGISKSHLQLLRTGKRQIPRLSPETMDKIAQFLALPKVIVMLAGGQLKLEDFYQMPEVLETSLQAALQFIQKDPELGPYMPPSTFKADRALRRFIVLLYEKASGRSLIPGRASLAEIIESFKPIAPS
jgi:transcriptional regulator with XRE-family HTH domain